MVPQISRFLLPTAAAGAIAVLASAAAARAVDEGGYLWQIGRADNNFGEFAGAPSGGDRPGWASNCRTRPACSRATCAP